MPPTSAGTPWGAPRPRGRRADGARSRPSMFVWLDSEQRVNWQRQPLVSSRSRAIERSSLRLITESRNALTRARDATGRPAAALPLPVERLPADGAAHRPGSPWPPSCGRVGASAVSRPPAPGSLRASAARLAFPLALPGPLAMSRSSSASSFRLVGPAAPVDQFLGFALQSPQIHAFTLAARGFRRLNRAVSARRAREDLGDGSAPQLPSRSRLRCQLPCARLGAVRLSTSGRD